MRQVLVYDIIQYGGRINTYVLKRSRKEVVPALHSHVNDFVSELVERRDVRCTEVLGLKRILDRGICLGRL